MLFSIGNTESGTWEEQFSSSIQRKQYYSLGTAPLSNSNSFPEMEEEIKLSNMQQGREEKTNSAVKLLTQWTVGCCQEHLMEKCALGIIKMDDQQIQSMNLA